MNKLYSREFTFLFLNQLILIYIDVLLACIKSTTFMQCYRGQKGVSNSSKVMGTGATDSCELPHGCREGNLGPLEEQPVMILNC